MRKNIFLTFLVGFGIIALIDAPTSTGSITCDYDNEIELISNNSEYNELFLNQEDCINNNWVNSTNCLEDGDLASQERYCLYELDDLF